MAWFERSIKNNLNNVLNYDKSILLFGPRQTGKTSLVKTLAHDVYINLMDAKTLRKYESEPSALIEEVKVLSRSLAGKKPLIIIDEIQKIPNLTDAVQILIDEKYANFIITGSSARKIKNLLPGRVIRFSMTPLSISEQAEQLSLDNALINGALPEILTIDNQQQIDLQLDTYVNVYLEEEIRKEALVRNMGAFNNFLRLACIESGNLVNFSNISQEIGVAHSTVAEYYNILEDCMLVNRIEPLTHSNTRKTLTKAKKYIIFDLGVRRIGAIDPVNPTIKQKAELFEQLIGLELHKLLLELEKRGNILYWRDHSGPEVDYVIEYEGKYLAIEVKWTENPSAKDAKHLKTFSNEYKTTKNNLIICRADLPRQLADNVLAVPWTQLNKIFEYASY